MVAGGFLTLSLGSATVFAAGPGTTAHVTATIPQTSSKPHKHEHVDCDPGHVSATGHCHVTFLDVVTKGEKNPAGLKVCFTVTPAKAGAVTAACDVIGKNGRAFGTFTASGNFCGRAVITATEAGEHQSHHTTVTITCKDTATTTAAMLAAGSPIPPTGGGGGWLLGAMGVGAALVTAYAVRTRRWFVARRLAANQSA